MLQAIKLFFKKHLQLPETGEKVTDEQALQLSAAVLFVEVMEADHVLHEEERQAVLHAIQTTFEVSENKAQKLMECAEAQVKGATSLHEFTTVLNRELDPDQKVKLLEQIWRIVFADSQLDKYEEHLVRRMADLLYISHADFIRAKHRAQP